jgi:hypothetical protein
MVVVTQLCAFENNVRLLRRYFMPVVIVETFFTHGTRVVIFQPDLETGETK